MESKPSKAILRSDFSGTDGSLVINLFLGFSFSDLEM